MRVLAVAESSNSSKRSAKIGDRGLRISPANHTAGSALRERTRALDLLTQFGPPPSESLLVDLTRDADPRVRAHAVLLLGTHSGAATRAALTAALRDEDSFVRRRACEAFVQARLVAPIDKLLPLFADPDRFIRYAAHVAFEHGDPGAGREMIFAATSHRAKLVGMLALVPRPSSTPWGKTICSREN